MPCQMLMYFLVGLLSLLITKRKKVWLCCCCCCWWWWWWWWWWWNNCRWVVGQQTSPFTIRPCVSSACRRSYVVWRSQDSALPQTWPPAVAIAASTSPTSAPTAFIVCTGWQLHLAASRGRSTTSRGVYTSPRSVWCWNSTSGFDFDLFVASSACPFASAYQTSSKSNQTRRSYDVILIFTALHGMQTRSSDENSVCPSVCLSHACIVTKR